jgi:chitodextrinase
MSTSDTQPPTAPGSLTAAPGTPTSSTIVLRWTASTDNVGVAAYYIYRTTQGNTTQVGQTTTLSFTNTGLTPNTGYSYIVKAIDAAGNLSPASNSARAKTTK